MRTRIPHALACAIAMCLAAAGTASAAEITASNTAEIVINPSGAGTVYGSEIAVGALPGDVQGVTVTLHGVHHTYPDDIEVLLVAPNGQKIKLMSDVGGATDLTGVTLSFSANAAARLPDIAAIVSGTYLPSDVVENDPLPDPAPQPAYTLDMTVLNGPASDMQGTWRLYVADDQGGDGGRIAGGWTLAITTAGTVSDTPSPDAPSAGFDSCEGYSGSQYALCHQICEADRSGLQGLNGLLNAWERQFGGTPSCRE